MRLISYETDGQTKLGSWIDGDTRIVDLASAEEAYAAFSSMQALIEAGPPAWARARELTADPPVAAIIPTAAVTLRAPLPRPIHIRDCLSFEQHLINATKATVELICSNAPEPAAARQEIERSGAAAFPQVWWERAIYYNANPLTVTDPEVDVVAPRYTKLFDFELEMAAIIGSQGKDVAEPDANELIFGYTIYNDWSARDEQMKAMSGRLGPGKGKDFDQGLTLGPCIVTADEIPDPYDLTMVARVNGEEWSRGSSSTMQHRFPWIIADLTRSQSIYAGEVLGSGTVGLGCGLELLRFLRNEDVVELEIERLGILRNRVIIRPDD
jgi:2-keto-4-pentenoate hydratase/2-oxohepta-3-ene-1,7-dioic acid hydratase in catechol pathway